MAGDAPKTPSAGSGRSTFTTAAPFEQPRVLARVGQCGDEIVRPDGAANDVRDAEPQRLRRGFRLTPIGDRHHRQRHALMRGLAQIAQRLGARREIQQHHLGPSLRGACDRLRGGVDEDRNVAGLGDNGGDVRAFRPRWGKEEDVHFTSTFFK
jgi:hypothetical protein